MRFSIDVGSELELKLYQAVLLYRNDHGNRFMATVHGVVQKETDGTPLLGCRPTAEYGSLRELTRQLGTSCPAEFLPDHVVARTPELIAWWTPAAVRPMFFRDGSELAGISGKLFPHPALLFVVRNGVLFVRALPANRRPDPDTRLAAAPYWNIDSNGAVCAGTMRAPKSLTVASIPAWQQAFFQSEFTHPGGAGRLTKRQGGTAALWKSLAGKKRFPLIDADRDGAVERVPEKTGGGTAMTHTARSATAGAADSHPCRRLWRERQRHRVRTSVPPSGPPRLWTSWRPGCDPDRSRHSQ